MAAQLTGQNALITGASRGIGRATALAFARAGVNVALTARSKGELETVADACRSLGVDALTFPADAADAEAVSHVCRQVLDQFRQVDILVNNAGVARYASIGEHTVDDYDWMMNTNMRSTFLFTRGIVPSMIAREQGCVIFVSSQAGVNGFPNETVYCATKHAQVGFATALDGEVRPHNIKVSIIAPGGVHTDFAIGTGRTEDMPGLQDMSESETIADAIVFAAQQPEKTRVLMIGLRPMSEKLYGGA